MSATASEPAPAQVSARSPHGFQLSYTPQLGGKVTSLRYGDTGRQWLAEPVRPLGFPDRADQPWDELDCSGWDECFPNIGRSDRLGLLDHGDVWRHPWTDGSAQESSESPQLSGWVSPPGRGYRFSRDIHAMGSRLKLDYLLENVGDQELHWAWSQHALLTADERTRLVVPTATPMRVDGAFRHGRPDRDVRWLLDGDILAPSTSLERAGGRAVKLWFSQPLPTAVAVVHGSEWLAWLVGLSTFTALGLWVNLGGWGGSPLSQIAVEPAFGADDDPAVAFATSPPLPPGQARRWEVMIRAGRGLDELDAALRGEVTSETL